MVRFKINRRYLTGELIHGDLPSHRDRTENVQPKERNGRQKPHQS